MDRLQRNVEAYDEFADVQTQPQAAGEKHLIESLCDRSRAETALLLSRATSTICYCPCYMLPMI